MTPEAHYARLAPDLCATLLGDFPELIPADADAVFGNGGYESLGFTKLQEMKPTVPGSRGGWGLMQWTGPRRRDFEAYCKRNGKDPSDIRVNYAWLFVELKSTEKRAIAAVKSASGLKDKVEAFERSFLRAGVKAYDKRLRWARLVESACRDAPSREATPTPTNVKREILVDEATASTERSKSSQAGAVGSGAAGGGAGTFGGVGFDAASLADWLVVGIGAGFFALAVWLTVRAWRQARRADDLWSAAALGRN